MTHSHQPKHFVSDHLTDEDPTPDQSATPDLSEVGQGPFNPSGLLVLVASAIRGAGPAMVLASIDALEDGHLSTADVIAKLRRMSRIG